MIMLLYLLFLVSVLVLSSFLIGPFTGRVWAVMMMCLYLIFVYYRDKRFYNVQLPYIYLFIAYIFLLAFTQFLNGDFETLGLKWILANHFVSIVVIIATFNITREKMSSRMDVIISAITVLIIVDSFVTIAQYDNSPSGWAINLFLTQGRNEKIVDFLNSSLSLQQTVAGFAKTPGLFNDVVDNAIFLGSFGLLPFYFIQKKSKVIKILTICVLALTLTACYTCQERAALLTFTASILFLFFKYNQNKPVGIILSVIVFITIINMDFSKYEFGRFQELGMFSNDARQGIWDKAVPYLSENWLLGGLNKFTGITGGSLPHNFFLNAFVFAGFCGGIVIIVLLVMILLRILKNINSGKSTKTTIIVSMALLSILVQSFVHNMSIITGDVFSFLLIGLMIVSEKQTPQIDTYLKKRKVYEHSYSIR